VTTALLESEGVNSLLDVAGDDEPAEPKEALRFLLQARA